MKKIIIIVLLLVLYSNIAWAAPEENQAIPFELLEESSVNQVNHFIQTVNKELHEDIPLLTTDVIKDIASKGFSIDWQAVGNKFIAYLFKELATNIHLMGKLLFLAVLCALLQNLQNSFEQSSISLLSYSVCFIFLCVIALSAFYQGLSLARETVGNIVGFMEALLPLLLSLLAGVGALTSAALFTPLMLFVVSATSVVVKDIILPLLFLTAVLECVNYLSGKYKLSNLTSVLKQAGMMVLGLVLVVFIGIVSIQGVAGSVADGLTLRTAKYATATFIPVVGKMFADTVELVMGASLVLKNAVGIFGVLTIALLCALPVIKLISLVVVIKIAGALIQPMGDENMAKCLDAMGNNLLLVFGALLTVVLMLFLVITMIIGAGSVAMMLR
ncbi:stage III sporulation protein AE [Sporomusa sphaeroides]|uniref:Stage III sporulation protein AE n=1 Tax=Sporomusa sphaeroides DSM 2875 TaxID=1337886 RepID=A0ABM9W389_9FIRM|nr:stage III sporulation protein AE [Sporomusa sphaeroides]OLS58496.1 stage III sporulation protein AE precursor [Sporomusa sphaeroides DSM 2875]CVK19636.1 Stage III sporulation protein AE precursor [Sporomusa sphaeroides DSM 2875]